MTAFLVAARLWLGRLRPTRAIAKDAPVAVNPVHIAPSPLLAVGPAWNGPTRRLPVVANYGAPRDGATTEVQLTRSTNYDDLDVTQWDLLGELVNA